MKRILLWFRNDLRLIDHEALHNALRKAEEIIPYYCFDVRQFADTRHGFPKTGSFRAKFLLESVHDLRRRIGRLGGKLVVESGKPEEKIARMVAEMNIDAVYAHKEVTDGEVKVEEALEHALWRLRVPMEYFWGASLYHLEDLPFPTKNLPEVFSDFRKQVERYVAVREPLPGPAAIRVPEQLTDATIPWLSDFNLKEPPNDERTVLRFIGGETTAHDRMQHYFYKVDGIWHYKDTRNGLTGSDYSSKLAPWLAAGCLSPRTVFKEVLRYESLRGSNESARWLLVELMWRDFFRLIARKHANNLFKPGGIKQAFVPMVEDRVLFEKWRTGVTGIPFIDANMQELLRTGYMSSRGRQNVASFLVKDLGLNWVPGADWFESQLIDYDPASNWGNWNYVAGVGNDPKEGRYFNPLKQAREYDPEGTFVKLWLPALRNIPANKVHTPWLLNAEERTRYQLVPGVDYPLHLVGPWGKALTR